MTTPGELFGRDKALIAMVHVAALPGTPRHSLLLKDIVAQARREASLLVEAGFDALILENMHDVPYLRRQAGPEIVAAMTAVGLGVREVVSVPLGVQILAGANHEALAVAHAIGGQFIRAEGFVHAAVADEGLLEEADAGPLLRYRRQLEAQSIHVLADVKKKHSAHAITADVTLPEAAKAAEFFGAGAVIVTGTATGEPVATENVSAVRAAVTIPVLVGSGVTPSSAAELLAHADGLIVGSWYKRDGLWHNPPEFERAVEVVKAASVAR